MKLAKRILALLLMLTMVCSMAACSILANIDPDDVLSVLSSVESYLNESSMPEAESSEVGSTPQSQAPPESKAESKPVSSAPESKAESKPVSSAPESKVESKAESKPAIAEDGEYTTKEDVALYLHAYGKLPGNFITKKEAQSYGWSGGGLDKIKGCYGKCIGGDHFGNYEKLLPTGYSYTECDIDTLHANSRGAKRIIFAEGGKYIYFTDDHYETFTCLYGE